VDDTNQAYFPNEQGAFANVSFGSHYEVKGIAAAISNTSATPVTGNSLNGSVTGFNFATPTVSTLVTTNNATPTSAFPFRGSSSTKPRTYQRLVLIIN
jgi:hypothetical protein